MTYDSRKLLHGQEFVEEIEIRLNACRYSLTPYIDNKDASITGASGPFSASYTGSVPVVTFTFSSTHYAIYNGLSNLYARFKVSGEIVKITVGLLSMNISERGLFGSIASIINGGDEFVVIHHGEADSSCRGFSQTCTDSTSYDANAIKSLRFCTSQRVAGDFIFPGLFHKKITHDSPEVDPGESIGGRARLRVSLSDFIDDDIYVVPYSDKRSSKGTFWGKMLARHPYFDSRKVIHRYGLRDAGSYEDPDWVEHEYLIDTFKLSNGVLDLSCLDPIILSEDKKAKMPVLSPAILEFAITGTPTTFTYLVAPDYYFGAMSADIIVRIDSEVIRCTVSGAKELAVVERGYRSDAKDHEAGATIQDCIRLDGTHTIDAIVFAMENYTRIPAAYIGDYSAAIAANPSAVLNDSLITKPYPVIDFINEMIKLGNLIFKYDEDIKQISISHIAETAIEPISVNGEDNIKMDSVSIDFNQKEQFTRFSILWNPSDITKDNEENYQIAYMAINIDVESENKLGQPNEKKVMKSFLLNGSPGDSLLATSYADRVIRSSSSYPKIASFKLDARDVGTNGAGSLSPGAIINLLTQGSQDKDGSSISELYQVLKISGNAFSGFLVKAIRYQALTPENIDFTIEENKENYDLSVYFAPSAGTYVVYISPGVVIASTDTSIPAFTTGSQAAGVSFVIINRGSILGMGGVGGDCELAATSPSVSVAGLPGGTAFDATVDCEIDCGSGLIWAGGGGAGGEDMTPNGSPSGTYYSSAKGGGGGQGYAPAQSGRYSLGGFEPISFEDRPPPGNQASPGVTGGGEWGKNGASLGADGGIAGEAIKSNGNTVTITAGNNDFNIRGRRT